MQRIAHGLVALISLVAVVTSLNIGSWKDSELPPDAGYSGRFEAGWEHMLNQPSYFTFLSCLLVLITSVPLVVRPHIRSASFHAVRIAGVVCVVITGSVFNLLLRDSVPLEGVEWINDRVAHVVAPVVTPAVWVLFGPRGGVTWLRILASSVFPLGWLAVTLLRGPVIDWYPYRILDVAGSGWGTVVPYVVGILAFYFVVAAAMWLIDRAVLLIRNRRSRRPVLTGIDS